MVLYPGLAIEADCLMALRGGFGAVDPVGAPLDNLCFFVALPDEAGWNLEEGDVSIGPWSASVPTLRFRDFGGGCEELPGVAVDGEESAAGLAAERVTLGDMRNCFYRKLQG